MTRILIAEDDLMFRELLSEVLTEAGFDVEAAVDGQAAWEALLARGADLLVADYNMPRLDGLGLIANLRRDPRFARLPVLMLTVRALVEDQTRGFGGGADDYLTKPFDNKMLVARIRVLLRRIPKEP